MSAEFEPCATADRACDVVIVGCGVAGLYTALMLPEGARIIMLSKGAVDECDSMLAQGGIYARLWAHQSGGFLGADDEAPEAQSGVGVAAARVPVG